jgi:hypothetical protein
LCRAAIQCAFAEENDALAIGKLLRHGWGIALDVAFVFKGDLVHGRLPRLGDLLILVIFDQGARVQSSETLERPDVEQDVYMADNDAKTLAGVMFDVIRLLFERDRLKRVERRSNRLGMTAHALHVVAERVVRDADHQAFLEIRPRVVDLLAKKAFGNLGSDWLVVLAGKGDYHALIS